ncbi:transcriptional regulator [Mycobacterium yunnanensis]|uniref:Transcriptional regulator n=1 Tax=Mycobacterium yunnanensis TaxID=368477 RepID=A0A9X2YWT7_9MYCO|nr:transcriptional regulator [Mycobacterium yunnanensis]
MAPLSEVAALESAPAEWHFGEFVLDLRRYELRRNGITIPVEPQVFDVLTLLVTHHDRVVTKIELFDSVWGGRFVGDAALSSRIKSIRQALGDSGELQHTIRTVRGRGYQFVGDPRSAETDRADGTSEVEAAQGRVLRFERSGRGGVVRRASRTRGYAYHRLVSPARRRDLVGPPK